MKKPKGKNRKRENENVKQIQKLQEWGRVGGGGGGRGRGFYLFARQTKPQ